MRFSEGNSSDRKNSSDCNTCDEVPESDDASVAFLEALMHSEEPKDQSLSPVLSKHSNETRAVEDPAQLQRITKQIQSEAGSVHSADSDSQRSHETKAMQTESVDVRVRVETQLAHVSMAVEIANKPRDSTPSEHRIHVWKCIRKKLQHRLSRNRLPESLLSYAEESLSLQDMLLRTIERGENQSVVLIGSGGSGKKLVVRHALKQLSVLFEKDSQTRKRAAAAATTTSPWMEVYIDGATLTNELAAFREVLRQLAPGEVMPSKNRSFAHCYDYLRNLLREKQLEGTSVIFILEGIEFFTEKSRQMFLYNLLDWMQTDFVRIALVALTANFGILQRLEKRVKSRFSSRQIILKPPPFAVVLQILREYLSIEAKYSFKMNTSETQKRVYESAARQFNDVIRRDYSEKVHLGGRDFDPESIQSFLKRFYDLSKSIKWMLQLHRLAVRFISPSEPTITKNLLQNAVKIMEPNPDRVLIKGLSTPELMLLIAMIRLEDVHRKTYTFEMVFQEYAAYARARNAHSISTVSDCASYSRQAMLHALENLKDLSLVRKVELDIFNVGKYSSTDSIGFRVPFPIAYQVIQMMCCPEELQRMIRDGEIHCTTSMKQWALRGEVS